MPVALPSLASCLQTLCLGHFNSETQAAVTERLGISSVEVEEIGRWGPTQHQDSRTHMCLQPNGFLFHAALQVFCRWVPVPRKEAGWADRGAQHTTELWRHKVLWKRHVSFGALITPTSHRPVGTAWHSSRWDFLVIKNYTTNTLHYFSHIAKRNEVAWL